MTRRRRALLLVLTGALAATSAVLPTTLSSPATAATAASKTAASKTVWKTHYCYGKTVKVDDGDTIRVKLTKGCLGWKKGKTVVVRNAAIQATEVAHSWAKAECWGSQGAAFMRKQFPKKSKVRLTAYTRTLSDQKAADGSKRYVMYAYSYHPKTAGGPWIDAQAKLLDAGLAFPKAEHVESARNVRYLALAQKAAYYKKGMWGNPSKCGSHTPGAKLQAWTGWKTDGADSKSTANSEWFKVRNVGTVSVPLYHWKIRDGSHTFGGGKKPTYTINSRVTLRPGQVLTLYPGKGTNDASSLKFYNNHPRLPFYPNAHADKPSDKNATKHKRATYYGYATILMDPSGNFRAQSMYPCVYRCGAPSVRVTSVDPKGGPSQNETATLVNTGTTTADLTGVVVQLSSARREFAAGTTLAPGARLVVHFDQDGANSSSALYFGSKSDGSRLRDAGGKVWLRTANATTMSMYSWGDGGTYVF